MKDLGEFPPLPRLPQLARFSRRDARLLATLCDREWTRLDLERSITYDQPTKDDLLNQQTHVEAVQEKLREML